MSIHLDYTNEEQSRVGLALAGEAAGQRAAAERDAIEAEFFASGIRYGHWLDERERQPGQEMRYLKVSNSIHSRLDEEDAYRTGLVVGKWLRRWLPIALVLAAGCAAATLIYAALIGAGVVR